MRTSRSAALACPDCFSTGLFQGWGKGVGSLMLLFQVFINTTMGHCLRHNYITQNPLLHSSDVDDSTDSIGQAAAY